MTRFRIIDIALGIIGLIALLALWQLVTSLELISRVFLPSPAATISALEWGVVNGDLVPQTLATINRMIQGWFLASLVAIAVGSLIGVSPAARAYIQPTLEFLRPLPASAIIPVAISLFGLNASMVLGVVVFGAVWPTLLGTIHGFAHVEPRLVEVSRLLQMSRWEFIYKIGLPNAVPDILAGMRLSLTVALILAVVGELLTAQEGLGTAVLHAARSYRAADLYAGILLLGLIGLISNYGLAIADKRILAWKN
ncbi:MAG TPA: ABC transporter permease [Xanthobacteraceae bacterium]|nr:ABC transporter permease [Xanthobacteraceae bacterium]